MNDTKVASRRLGGTEMQISRLGLGAWALGGAGWKWAWGPQDDADSIATIRRAVDLGISWIDTAPMYGLGHSEEIVGKAIAQIPEADRPLIFTKAGLVWDPERPGAAPRKIMSATSVRREVDESLARLGVERIDLYQVHWPGDGALLDWDTADPDPLADAYATAIEDYWQTMEDLRVAGKVRAIGLSNHSVAQLERAERVARVDAIQPQFSLMNREAAPEIGWAEGHRAAALVYQPLHSGLLTGAFTTERVADLPADDWRAHAADFTIDLRRNLALVDALAPVAERHGVTVGAIAIAWALAWPGVTGAIVGARRPGQLDAWLAAAQLRLEPADMSEIEAALVRTRVGTGPVRAGAGND